MKKIAYIDSIFPTYHTFLSWEMLHIQKLGNKIYIFPLRPKQTNNLIHPENEKLMNDVFYVKIFSLNTLLSFLYWLTKRPIKLFVTFFRILKAYSSDYNHLFKTLYGLIKGLVIAKTMINNSIQHAHSNWAHIPATITYFIAELTDVTFSFSAHAGADLYRTQNFLPEKINGAKFILTCTKKNKSFLSNYAPNDQKIKSIHVAYHGINIKSFSSDLTLNKYLNKGKDQLIKVISVGSIDYAKGHIYMVRACSKMIKNGFNIEYQIIGGEGDAAQSVKNEVKKLNISDFVKFEGLMSKNILIKKLKNADFFIMPSIELENGAQDGIPNAILESMGLKLPVLATDAGAITEVLTHGQTGILIKQESAESIVEEMKNIFNGNYNLSSMINNANYLVNDKFDRDQCVKNIGLIFNKNI